MLRIRKQATKRDVLGFRLPMLTHEEPALDITDITVIAMQPNRAMAEIHDRMPAILERADIKTWLNVNLTGQQRTAVLLSKPCLPEALKITVEKEY